MKKVSYKVSFEVNISNVQLTHITTRFKCDYPIKIDRLWHLNEKKYSFREETVTICHALEYI